MSSASPGILCGSARNPARTLPCRSRPARCRLHCLSTGLAGELPVSSQAGRARADGLGDRGAGFDGVRVRFATNPDRAQQFCFYAGQTGVTRCLDQMLTVSSSFGRALECHSAFVLSHPKRGLSRSQAGGVREYNLIPRLHRTQRHIICRLVPVHQRNAATNHSATWFGWSSFIYALPRSIISPSRRRNCHLAGVQYAGGCLPSPGHAAQQVLRQANSRTARSPAPHPGF